MKWKIKILDQSLEVEIPNDLTVGVVFSAKVNNDHLKFKVLNSKPLELALQTNEGWSNLLVHANDIQPHPLGYCDQHKVEYRVGGSNKLQFTHAEVQHNTPALVGQGASNAPKDYIVKSPMTGALLSIACKEGDSIDAGSLLCIIEAMKMENSVLAKIGGTIEKVFAQANTQVKVGQKLFSIKVGES